MTIVSTYCIRQSTRSDGTFSSDGIRVPKNGFYADISSSSFTGKELDAETGYSYFGARYYAPATLTAWLSVDPMSDKYPSISPYAYCAWNPLKLVDPDGMEIVFNPQVVEKYGKRLTDCLSKITGLTLSIDANGRLSYAKDGNGNAVASSGSVTARAALIEAIDKKNVDGTNYLIDVGAASRCLGVQNEDKRGGMVGMNCGIMNKNEDAATNGMGMIFMHEIRHAVTGEKDPVEGGITATYSKTGLFVPETRQTGSVVDRVNVYRQELGMAIRMNYFGRPTDGKVPFMCMPQDGSQPNSQYIQKNVFYLQLSARH